MYGVWSPQGKVLSEILSSVWYGTCTPSVPVLGIGGHPTNILEKRTPFHVSFEIVLTMSLGRR